MSLTSLQIIALARKKILEESTDIVTDSDLYIYLNQTYDDLKFRTFTNDQIKSATVTLTSGVGSLPADFGTLYGPGYKDATNKTPYEEKSIADFYRDQSIEGMTVEQNELKVSPDTLAEILIKYYPSYQALTSSQNPEIHDYLQECLIYGTVYRAFEDLQNPAMSQYYRGIYDEEFAKRTSGISNYEEDNYKGVLFNYTRLI